MSFNLCDELEINTIYYKLMISPIVRTSFQDIDQYKYVEY